MVNKIQNSEYLKRYDSMTAAERAAYHESVAQWMRSGGKLIGGRVGDISSRMQNVLSVSAVWNAAECQAFEEGARLLTALVGKGETWLPEMLYAKAAARCVKQMNKVLAAILNEANIQSEAESPVTPEAAPVKRGPGRPRKVESGKVKVESGELEVESEEKVVTPARPRHFDQYAHLLPKKTQERIAKYGPLMRGLEDARKSLQLLIGDVTASPADREAWAKRATAIDKELGAIRREADAEWDKLVQSGRVVLDDMGNARVVDCPVADAASAQLQNGEAQNRELTSEEKARRRELRKWLVDKRYGNGDSRAEHVRQWREYFLEYVTLRGTEAFEEEKVVDAARHYGIELSEMKSKNR